MVAHPGTQYSFSLARELHFRGRLSGFHTCMALGVDSKWRMILEPLAKRLKVDRQLQNRVVQGVPANKIHLYPLLEIGAWWRTKRGSAAAHTVLRDRNDAFQQAIPDEALDASDIVIGFDTSAELLGERTRASGRPLVLDRSIAHPRSYARVAEDLMRRFPEWHDSASSKSETDLRIEDREHDLATLIVVPSGFVADTLVEQGVPRAKIRVNPFGTDLRLFHPAEESADSSTIIFLFVGALLARKGLPLLLDAWRRLRPRRAELWIAGGGSPPPGAVDEAGNTVRWLGPISRQALPGLFRRAHVFVFPSFFEGLAQVQLEAAACALPIIATTASGGEEIVEDGKTGFIIDAGSLDQLVERIEHFATHRDTVVEMRSEARRRVQRWSWDRYGDRWHQLLSAPTLPA
jgi:alpha-maltose-1-phosphate synthase